MATPRLKRDWKGLRVRSLRLLRSSWAEVPAGTLFTVRRNFNGLQLESDPCPNCGIKFFISKVPEDAVVIVQSEDKEVIAGVFNNPETNPSSL